MPKDEQVHLALSDAAARQLANATKTTAQLDTITPRWLTACCSGCRSRRASTA
jgi:hypothetical protein